jgi:maltose alpha-D-glucosyltransferase/alpha-amylase
VTAGRRERAAAGGDADWYKDAIVYALDVRTFADGDGDGIGDFPGLTARLDYLAALGVTCLWLLPFYPTPNRDNGYDVADYDAIDPRLGTLDDFRAFRRAATERGMKLILDLVVHHSSDEHPWFRAARAVPTSPYRPYYVWAERPPAAAAAKLIFPGVEESVWTFDEAAGAFYLHQFYAFQPDLNVEHPPVQEEARRIMARWRDLGADGFRVDAASHLLGTEALLPRPTTQPHAFLRRLRADLDEHRPGGALIGEADVEPDRLAAYFGRGDELHLLFNFLLANYVFLALARGEAEPIARGLRLLPDIPPAGQWANFLRNLDELDLERLTDSEREEVYRAFAPDPRMRAYGKGIRRRLAPMLGGAGRRLRLAFSLLLTLPGTPILVYGDELGMGDDLSLPERRSVRPAMQWSGEANGGFSPAPRNTLAAPVIAGGEFGYGRVNVADQERDPGSLLSWMRRALAARRACPAFGRGAWRVLETDERCALAVRFAWQGTTVVALHNLADRPCAVGLDPDGAGGGPLVDLFADRAYAPVERGGSAVALDGYGYRWLRSSPASSPNRSRP